MRATTVARDAFDQWRKSSGNRPSLLRLRSVRKTRRIRDSKTNDRFRLNTIRSRCCSRNSSIRGHTAKGPFSRTPHAHTELIRFRGIGRGPKTSAKMPVGATVQTNDLRSRLAFDDPYGRARSPSDAGPGLSGPARRRGGRPIHGLRRPSAPFLTHGQVVKLE